MGEKNLHIPNKRIVSGVSISYYYHSIIKIKITGFMAGKVFE